MRILVTGSSGHVGGAIARHLTECGHDVVGLSRGSSPGLLVAEQVQADLSVDSCLDTIFRSVAACDAVVHAGAKITSSFDDCSMSFTNCGGTHQMVALARAWQAKSFVYLSSVPIIGRPLFHPITEEHPLTPPTAYHASKLYGEHVAGLSQLNAAILRLTSPVGPGLAPGRIFSEFVRNALAGKPLRLAGQGTRQQNYVDVRDAARAVESCIIQQVTGIYNVAGARAISNYDLAIACRDRLGSRSEIAFTGQPDTDEGVVWDVSIEKAATTFGYAPQHSIEDSIRDLAGAASK
jgi:UDP-glucose 4-epimerase